MNFDLTTMASFGFTFYNDELNEDDLRILADELPTIISGFVDLSSDAHAEQDIIEPATMEIESMKPSPSISGEISYKDQVLMVIEQYNNQQTHSPSPASSEASSTASTDSLAIGIDEVSKAIPPETVDKIKKPRGRKIKKPRDEAPGKFYCDKCKKNFRSLHGLKQHTNSHHTGIKAHGCEICGKRFDLLEEMKKHRERHSTENKPFGCRVDGCPKRFMYEFDMDRHVAVKHATKSPFSCDICNKVFGRKDHLEKHTNSHKFNTDRKC